MKKLMIALLFVLMSQLTTSCTKTEMGDNANNNQVEQAGDYGGDDDVPVEEPED